MTTLVRWLRFNLVGGVGMAVQLVTLACFNRWMRGHYLWASAAAIEVTLLHNFVWHMRFTWRERCERTAGERTAWGRKLLQFHLSNGVVSMLGNLVLMRWLVHGVRLPLLGANAVAILVCSAVNFFVSDRWSFAAREISSCV